MGKINEREEEVQVFSYTINKSWGCKYSIGSTLSDIALASYDDRW